MLRTTTARCVSELNCTASPKSCASASLLARCGTSMLSNSNDNNNNNNNTMAARYFHTNSHNNNNATTTITTHHSPITEPPTSGISSTVAGGTARRASAPAISRSPICASAPLNAYLPESVSTVIARTAQGLLAQQQRSMGSSSVAKTTTDAAGTDVSPVLYENIYFAPEQASEQGGPTYVEVNRHELRLEFLDVSDAFTQHAALMFDPDVAAVDVSSKQAKIPSCFIPRKVENNISHGAGATIVLDKQEVLDYFKDQARM